MTSDAHRLLSRLHDLGIALAADGNDIAFEAPAGAMTDAVAADIRRHKPALLAILTGVPVPSHVPGWVWHPAGGFAAADPPCLRGVCLTIAGAAGYPRLPLPNRPSETVMAGEPAWRAFVRTCTDADLAHAITALDDAACPRSPDESGQDGQD